MPIANMLRLLLREALVPLLCAVLVLSGLAQARASGERLADPAATAQFLKCGKTLPEGGGDAPPDHDCPDCYLPPPAATNSWRIALALRFFAGAAPLPEAASAGIGRIATAIPWSRGPPAVS